MAICEWSKIIFQLKGQATCSGFGVDAFGRTSLPNKQWHHQTCAPVSAHMEARGGCVLATDCVASPEVFWHQHNTRMCNLSENNFAPSIYSSKAPQVLCPFLYANISQYGCICAWQMQKGAAAGTIYTDITLYKIVPVICTYMFHPLYIMEGHFFVLSR